MNGYIKLHRKILEWQWYGIATVRALFIHLLLKANYRDSYSKGDLIEKGQVAIGIHETAKELGFSVQQIRSALNKLKSTNEITIKTTNKGSVITIVNWADYQVESEEDNKQNNKQDNKPITNKQQTNNNQITTNKEYKEYKEYKEIKEYKKIYVQKQQEELFEIFWKEYPRKVAKGKCLNKFKSICKDEPMFNKLMEGLKKQKELIFKHTEEKYIPHPFTWLNQERWNDEVKSNHESYARVEKILPDYYQDTTENENVVISKEDMERLRNNLKGVNQ